MLNNDSFLSEYDFLLDTEIASFELSLVLKKLKTKKAPGLDLIPNEYFKYCPESWRLYLLNLYNKIFSSEHIPAAWSEVGMFMLHKKGDKLDSGNQHDIALVNCIDKIFTQILSNRLESWVESKNILPETQAGFRRGRGCEDIVYNLQSAILFQLRLPKRKVCCILLTLSALLIV